MDHLDFKSVSFLVGELLGIFAIVSVVFKYGFKSYLDKSAVLDTERQKAMTDALRNLNNLINEVSKDNKDVRVKIVEVEKSIIELRVKLAENFERRAESSQELRRFMDVTNERLSAIERAMLDFKPCTHKK